jgi:hypothetical protein
MNGTRLCARPGCSGTAAAWLTYDYAGQQVWLDETEGSDDGNRWALCDAHAEKLRAPKGWAFHDRRQGLTPHDAERPAISA